MIHSVHIIHRRVPGVKPCDDPQFHAKPVFPSAPVPSPLGRWRREHSFSFYRKPKVVLHPHDAFCRKPKVILVIKASVKSYSAIDLPPGDRGEERNFPFCKEPIHSFTRRISILQGARSNFDAQNSLSIINLNAKGQKQRLFPPSWFWPQNPLFFQ